MSKCKSYPSDLTDGQWEVLRPLLPKARKAGRPSTVDRRDLLDAILYILRTGCQWRQLPHDFPPWGTVSSQFCRWRKSGLWERIHHALYAKARRKAGKKPRPQAAPPRRYAGLAHRLRGAPGERAGLRRGRGRPGQGPRAVPPAEEDLRR